MLPKNILDKSIKTKLMSELKYKNVHQIPKIKCIIINSSYGIKAQNKQFMDKAIKEYILITSQKPVIVLSKKSVSAFKIKKGLPIGLKVTLRRKKMYDFIEKLSKKVLPDIKNYKGLNLSSFDKAGNFSFGIEEQIAFPDINYENVESIRGFNITICCESKKSFDTMELLKILGFNFKKV